MARKAEIVRPLTNEMVKAAGQIYLSLHGWQTTDRALQLLRDKCPGYGREDTLLKVVTVNALYWTQLYAVDRMARHIEAILANRTMPIRDITIVDEISRLPPTPGQRQTRKHVSFASKFAHFFISSDEFPIYDSIAIWMLTRHIPRKQLIANASQPYQAFVENLKWLRADAGLSHSHAELDRYLWLAGSYAKWRNGSKENINSELARMFTDPTSQQASDLRLLMPT